MDFKKRLYSFLKNKYNIAFIAVFLISLYLRLKFIFVDTIWPDEALYQWYGYKILHVPSYFFSKEFTEVVSYFPSTIMAFFNIFTNSFISGRITILLFALAGIILIYLLGKELKNRPVGLMAAILLSVNHLHWFIGSRTLLDVPLTTMFTFVGLCILKYENTKLRKWLIALLVGIALTIYTKNAGYLIIPFVGIYFILRYNIKILKFIRKKENFKVIGKKENLLAIGLFLLIISPFFIINLYNFGMFTHVSAKSVITPIEKVVNRMQPTENVFFLLTGKQEFTAFNFIFILSIIIYIIFMILYKTKGHFLLFSWLLSTWGLYTFLHPGTVPRYLIVCLPAIYLSISWVIFELGTYIKKIFNIKISSWIFVGLVILLAIPSYSLGNNLNIEKSYSYRGFKEAGEWLKDNIEKDAIVYSGSVRTLRAFSGIEEVERGGNLAGYPEKEDFEYIAKTSKVPIYIQIDFWESIQPEFVYPLTESKLNYLQNLGFRVVKTVEGYFYNKKGMVEGQIVFILKKE